MHSIYGMMHGLRIMTAWMIQAQPMMRMPFADMLESEFLIQNSAGWLQVVKVLIKEGDRMISVQTASDGLANDGCAL